MNTSTFSDDKKFDELNSWSRAISLLDKYDASSFIDAMQAARFNSTIKNRYGLSTGSDDDAFWDEVSASLQSHPPVPKNKNSP